MPIVIGICFPSTRHPYYYQLFLIPSMSIGDKSGGVNIKFQVIVYQLDLVNVTLYSYDNKL